MKVRLVAAAVFSGILYAVAMPNELFHYGNPFFGVFCLTPFFYILATARNTKSTVLSGILFGAVSTALTYFWLLFFQDFSIWTISGVIAAHLIYFAIFAPIAAALYRSRHPLRPFVIAAAWVCYEYVTSIGYLGFPWGLIALPASNILPLCQIADIFGVWGVSFLVAAANTLLTEFLLISELPRSLLLKQPNSEKVASTGLIPTSHIRQTSVLALLILCALLYGWKKLEQEMIPSHHLRVLMVQQNVDSWRSGRERIGLKRGQELTRSGLASSPGTIDLVVWSENSLRRPFDEFRSYFEQCPENDPFIRFLDEIDTELLVGAPYALDWQAKKVMNGAILLTPQAEIKEYYGKMHPVPLAEHIPFWDVPFIRRFFQEVVGLQSSGWTPGTRRSLFTVTGESRRGDGQVSFCVPICFEDSFPDLCRRMIADGADLLINLTNDSWSKTVAGETQHFVASRFRSIENRCNLIRSTNAGVTAVVDPWGRITHSLPLYESDSLYAVVPLYQSLPATVYTKLGDFFPICLCLFIVSILAQSLYTRRQIRECDISEVR